MPTIVHWSSFPHDLDVLKGLLEAHIARGTADEAAEILERAVADNPIETPLNALLRAPLSPLKTLPGRSRPLQSW